MITGWPPGLLQDDDRGLSKWFASKPDARRLVRERCKEIGREHMRLTALEFAERYRIKEADASKLLRRAQGTLT